MLMDFANFVWNFKKHYEIYIGQIMIKLWENKERWIFIRLNRLERSGCVVDRMEMV